MAAGTMGATVTPLRRRVTIGGSSAAAACGIDPHCSRIRLWCELTGHLERRETEAMEWGKRLEPAIVAALEDEGYTVLHGPSEYRDEARPWLVGHPDGFVLDEDGEALLELKTAGAWSAREWADESAPLAYVAQAQTYLHLTGRDRALLACLVGGQKLEKRTVRKDDRAIALMLARMDEFMGYVERNEPPPPDGSASSKQALLALYSHGNGKVVRLTGSDWRAYQDLIARREQGAAIDAQILALENQLKARMGEAEIAISPYDTEIAKWTTVQSKRLDASKVKAEYPQVYEQCVKTTETRRFTVA